MGIRSRQGTGLLFCRGMGTSWWWSITPLAERNITVTKEQVFSHVTEAGGIYQPQYETKGLPNAVYDITAR